MRAKQGGDGEDAARAEQRASGSPAQGLDPGAPPNNTGTPGIGPHTTPSTRRERRNSRTKQIISQSSYIVRDT